MRNSAGSFVTNAELWYTIWCSRLTNDGCDVDVELAEVVGVASWQRTIEVCQFILSKLGTSLCLLYTFPGSLITDGFASNMRYEMVSVKGWPWSLINAIVVSLICDDCWFICEIDTTGPGSCVLATELTINRSSEKTEYIWIYVAMVVVSRVVKIYEKLYKKLRYQLLHL